MQVYQQLDIGTAKANKEEQARVRHALLDCCALPEAFSAAKWAELAAAFIRSENEAGRVPLIVGGTGLYLRALSEGLADIPPEMPGVREGLLSRLETEGVQALHAELAKVDAPTAARLPDTDTQRILRALAVFHSSGRSLSDWVNEPMVAPPCDITVFVLDVQRDALREGIAQRFKTMLDAGWLDEVHWLAGLNLPDTHPAVRAVGYRQLLAHVEGQVELDQAVQDGITATRRYAKRQQTWFTHQTSQAVHGDAAELTPLITKSLQVAA